MQLIDELEHAECCVGSMHWLMRAAIRTGGRALTPVEENDHNCGHTLLCP